MKASKLSRAAALIASVLVTFATVQQIADYALPHGEAPQIVLAQSK